MPIGGHRIDASEVEKKNNAVSPLGHQVLAHSFCLLYTACDALAHNLCFVL